MVLVRLKRDSRHKIAYATNLSEARTKRSAVSAPIRKWCLAQLHLLRQNFPKINDL